MEDHENTKTKDPDPSHTNTPDDPECTSETEEVSFTQLFRDTKMEMVSRTKNCSILNLNVYITTSHYWLLSGHQWLWYTMGWMCIALQSLAARYVAEISYGFIWQYSHSS